MDPVSPDTRQARRLGEGRLRDLERIQPGAELQQQLRVETRADLAGKHEVVLIVMSNQQGTETLPSALRIGESSDDELLRRLAFHLQPVGRAAVLVAGVAPLGDDAFPTLR